MKLSHVGREQRDPLAAPEFGVYRRHDAEDGGPSGLGEAPAQLHVVGVIVQRARRGAAEHDQLGGGGGDPLGSGQGFLVEHPLLGGSSHVAQQHARGVHPAGAVRAARCRSPSMTVFEAGMSKPTDRMVVRL